MNDRERQRLYRMRLPPWPLHVESRLFVCDSDNIKIHISNWCEFVSYSIAGDINFPPEKKIFLLLVASEEAKCDDLSNLYNGIVHFVMLPRRIFLVVPAVLLKEGVPFLDWLWARVLPDLRLNRWNEA